MKIALTQEEQKFYDDFLRLKQEAGSHSPSIHRLLKEFPEVTMQVDACFLCNPYAYDIFMKRLKETNLEKYVKFYPPQNEEVAENISKFRSIPKENILVGNGAIEIIENLFKFVSGKNIVLSLPTFSTYYEVGQVENKILPYYLVKHNDFDIDVDDLYDFFKGHYGDILIIVNPNNPTGTLIKADDIIRLHQKMDPQKLLVVDESFIDFSSQENSIEKYAAQNDNIIIIRSMSKDFGIAGLRVGYAVMTSELRQKYMKSGFLWNSNGLAYYFTTLLADKEFQKEYKKAKSTYNSARDDFFAELQKIPGLKVYPSQANFFMLETEEDAGLLFTKLLYTYGIYTRILNDKWGLDGNYIRIASKDRKENRKMLHALKTIFK
jgi:histidinol-phosphate/aromatic aminotransferase/cobyric acid decarboxylase-like protein